MGISHVNPASKRPYILTAIVLTLLTSIAAASQEVDTINQLLSANNPQGAYNQAKIYQSVMEGDPLFDYAYGVAAVQSGHLSEGVLALERVVSLQPNNNRARFELAKAYYAIGDYVRARREFEQLKALSVSENEKAVFESYLAVIRQREGQYQTTSTAYVQISLGYDTNINTGPSGNLVYQSLPIYLSQSATDTPDAYSEVTAGGQIDHPFTRRMSVFGALNGRLRRHRDVDSYDNNLYGGQFGFKWTYKRYLVRGGALAQQYVVDGNVSRNLAGVTLEAINGLSSQATVGVAYSYLDLTYPSQQLRDSSQYTLGTTMTYRWIGKREPTLYLGMFGGEESAKQNSTSARSVAQRDLYGLHAGFDIKLSEKLGVRETVLVQKSEYAAPLFGALPKRNETLTSSEFTMTWLITKAWKASASYGFSQNESNINMYNYTRDQYGVTVRHEF